MTDSFLTMVFILLAKMFGGIEPAGLLLLILVAILAYVSKATLPTVFFVLFILIGALYGTVGGIFAVLYGLCILAGSVLFFLAAKGQFSQV